MTTATQKEHPVTYVLSVATDDTRDLIVDALESAADQRTAVAQGASGQLRSAEREGKEIRSKARRVVHLLADADELRRLAHALKTAQAIPVVSRDPDLAGVPLVVPAPATEPVDADGTTDADGATELLDPMAEPDPEGTEA